MNILFLYTELAGYFLSCVNELAKDKDFSIHIIRWPVNNEAPFKFSFNDRLKIYDRNSYDIPALEKLVKEIDPAFIYCSGWMDKGYLKAASGFTNKIPVVVGFDNHWRGDLKQVVASFISQFTIRKIFNHCWIPGEPQEKFARRLGFSDSEILKGFYSADVDLFNSLYQKYSNVKAQKYPHRFVFSGRYIPHKWVKELCYAFIEAAGESKTDWELWCLGTGTESKVKHERIRHLGFVQPEKMEEVIAATGVFVLPSTFEPWGVVVHEYAAAGFPLLCSNAVGAASAFLEEGKNGVVFKSGDYDDLVASLRNIMAMSDHELMEMGKHSNGISKTITPEKWAMTIKDLVKINVRN